MGGWHLQTFPRSRRLKSHYFKKGRLYNQKLIQNIKGGKVYGRREGCHKEPFSSIGHNITFLLIQSQNMEC